MGKDPWRFARSEMSLRPTSPTLTHTRNTDQACLRTGCTCAEQAGPRAPFPPGSVALAHGASLRESACLGQAWRQPCAQDHSQGPSVESAGSLSRTGNKGIINVTISTVKTTSLFVCHAPTVPQHYGGSVRSHSTSIVSETNASPGARDRWLAIPQGSSVWKNLLGLRRDRWQLWYSLVIGQKICLAFVGGHVMVEHSWERIPQDGRVGILEAPARTPEPSQCTLTGSSYRTKLMGGWLPMKRGPAGHLLVG